MTEQRNPFGHVVSRETLWGSRHEPIFWRTVTESLKKRSLSWNTCCPRKSHGSGACLLDDLESRPISIRSSRLHSKITEALGAPAISTRWGFRDDQETTNLKEADRTLRRHSRRTKRTRGHQIEFRVGPCLSCEDLSTAPPDTSVRWNTLPLENLKYEVRSPLHRIQENNWPFPGVQQHETRKATATAQVQDIRWWTTSVSIPGLDKSKGVLDLWFDRPWP